MESYLTPLSLVGPSSIRLLGVRESLSAGAPHEVSCEAAGARPPPEVTWWRGDTRIEAGVSPPQVSPARILFNGAVNGISRNFTVPLLK